MSSPSSSPRARTPVLKKKALVVRDKDALRGMLVAGVKIVKVCMFVVASIRFREERRRLGLWVFQRLSKGQHDSPHSLLLSVLLSSPHFSPFLSFLFFPFLTHQHGARGKPKLKTLLFNPEKADIEWHDEADAKKSRLGLMFGLSKAASMSSIRLADITEISKGCQSLVLERAVGVDPAKSFSLVTADRSLDVVMANTQDRDTMLRALRVIIEDAGLSPMFT